ncbi:MAG: hypothetical protein D3917_15865 [Candidatus Electrothrix sp. AX5]|nr:hypothetical protein [Candidatus Electrothrix sp. AX5]
MNKIELELTISESMSEQARNELKGWFEEFIRQYEVPSPEIVVKDGSTTVLITWILAGTGLVTAGCLTKVGEIIASWLTDHLFKRNSLSKTNNNISSSPILSSDLQHRDLLDRMPLHCKEAVDRSEHVVFKRIETVYDANSRERRSREQTIEFRHGELRSAIESVKTSLNVSEYEED